MRFQACCGTLIAIVSVPLLQMRTQLKTETST